MQGIRTKRKKSVRKSEPLQILIVNSKFKLTLTNPLKNGDWLIYYGTELFKNTEIIGFLKEKSEENNDKWKLNKPKQVAFYHPSFCFQELERDVIRVKEKQMQAVIFQRHGVSLFETLTSLGKIKANVLHLLILLFVKLLKKIHAQSLTLTSLSFKNIFIVWANIETPCLYLCNNSILKRNIVANNNPSIEKQKENNNNDRRGSFSKSPNNFRPSRRQSRLSINKGRIHKRENVQIALTKLTEIENDWNVMANANKKQRGCFEDIIKYISKESLDISDQEYKFDKWVNQIKRIINNSGIDLEEANNILLKNSKEILNVQYKNRTVSNLKSKSSSNETFFIDLSKNNHDAEKMEEDYHSTMNEGHQGLDENMKSHILTPFQKKKNSFQF